MNTDWTSPTGEAGLRLDGHSVVLGIIGDPIMQAKAPMPLTRLLQSQGLDAIVVPLHVGVEDIDTLLAGVGVLRNFAGFIVTVPHKQVIAQRLAGRLSPAAQRARAVNVVRRAGAGGWEADVLDGAGFVAGLRDAGFEPRGATAHIIGAGGAASAIAFSLGQAGVRRIGIHDIDAVRRDQLIAQLRLHDVDGFGWNGVDTRDATLLVNATPQGMRAGDPLPVPADVLHAGLWVADVIMAPAITPLLETAAARGCRTHEGRHMMERQLGLMAEFFRPAVRAIEADSGERA